MKRYLAHPAFAATTLTTWFRHYDRNSRITFTVDDEVIGEGPYAVISNSDPYTYVGHRPLRIAPGASLDDELTVTVHAHAARRGGRARRRRRGRPDHLPHDVARDRAARRRRARSRSPPTPRSRGRSTATTWARSSGSSVTYAPDCLSLDRPLTPSSGRDRSSSVMTASTPASRSISSCSASFTVHTFTCTPWSWARVTKALDVDRSSASTRRGARRRACAAPRSRAPRQAASRTTAVRSGGRGASSRTRSTTSPGRTTTPAPRRPPRSASRRDQHVVGPAGRVLDLDVHQPAPADVEHVGQGRDLGRARRARRGSARRAARPGCRRRGGPRARPSAVRCTSSSTPSAPRSTASSMAGTVFSGASRLAPRCASTSIPLTMSRTGEMREIPDQPLARASVAKLVSGSSASRFARGRRIRTFAHNWGNEAWH